jgi:hypothetical protein
MKRQDMRPVEIDVSTMWTLSPDRRSIWLTLPALPLERMAIPLTIALEVDASSVDEMIDRLTVLRAQMLPALPQRSSRN